MDEDRRKEVEAKVVMVLRAMFDIEEEVVRDSPFLVPLMQLEREKWEVYLAIQKRNEALHEEGDDKEVFEGDELRRVKARRRRRRRVGWANRPFNLLVIGLNQAVLGKARISKDGGGIGLELAREWKTYEDFLDWVVRRIESFEAPAETGPTQTPLQIGVAKTPST